MTAAAARIVPAIPPAVRLPQRIERAYFAAVRKYGQRPEVTGIDMGFKLVGGRHANDLSIRIHVREKHVRKVLSLREAFPGKILGVPTDVIEATYARHPCTQSPGTGFPSARASRQATLRPGISIGHLRGTAGTLGAIVTDQLTGLPALLGAAHVLFPDRECAPGDPIVQPGTHDGGSIREGKVGEIARADFQTDSAIAVLTGPRPMDYAQFGTALRLRGSRSAGLGATLEKSGRTSGLTRAFVDGLGTYGWLQYGMRLHPLEDGSEEAICLPGDSGSVWYDPDTAEGVGIHVMGMVGNSRYHSIAIASSLERSLASLNAFL